MADTRALARELREVAKKLEKAAVWKGSKLAVDAATDSFVYELLCYFHIALAAAAHFEIRVAGLDKSSGVAKPIARWPKSPGHKQNFSYFHLMSQSDDKYQLCPGINIKDKYNKLRAPDVNLLKGDSHSSPLWKDLLACWDAKFSSHDTKPLKDKEVADFIYTYQQLGNPRPPPTWCTAVTAPSYQRSGILTNAQASSEPDGALRENFLLETSGFPFSPKTRP